MFNQSLLLYVIVLNAVGCFGIQKNPEALHITVFSDYVQITENVRPLIEKMQAIKSYILGASRS